MSDSMPRYTFERILRNLNLCDNEKHDRQDKFSKLLPVINELSKNILKFSFNEENKSIDESMISCYGTHGSRQRINNKPIWLGYNIWILVEGHGYVVQFEPYQGVKKRNQAAPLLNGEWKKTLLCGWWNAYLYIYYIYYIYYIDIYYMYTYIYEFI